MSLQLLMELPRRIQSIAVYSLLRLPDAHSAALEMRIDVGEDGVSWVAGWLGGRLAAATNAGPRVVADAGRENMIGVQQAHCRRTEGCGASKIVQKSCRLAVHWCTGALVDNGGGTSRPLVGITELKEHHVCSGKRPLLAPLVTHACEALSSLLHSLFLPHSDKATCTTCSALQLDAADCEIDFTVCVSKVSAEVGGFEVSLQEEAEEEEEEEEERMTGRNVGASAGS
ncbi:hypothetical protein TcWFU_009641 [Taenia crassiceps]|uniref:Uncharacterized protein n=1 Tax=Taenia crassiceps TaxID=6207 RepID=A0ABR4QCG6_9CEST